MKTKLWCGVVLAAVIAMGVTESASSAGPGGGGFGRGRPSFDTLLSAFDADEDGELAEDEVPAPVWLRLSMADADDNGLVTRDEFDSFKPGGNRPSFDKLLSAFDADEDGELAEDEVPAPVWLRLSMADADDNGLVTRDEFDSFKPGSNN